MRPLRLAPAAALRLAAAAAAALSETDRKAAPAPTYFTNPVLAHDFPDPTVLRGSDGVFYVYATMGGGHHIQVASSPDLVAWEYHGEALEPPAWMGSASWEEGAARLRRGHSWRSNLRLLVRCASRRARRTRAGRDVRHPRRLRCLRDGGAHPATWPPIAARARG